MKQPCDDAVIASGTSTTGCKAESAPWVLAATILGSSMAFIDSTVVNVALPALQSSLHATVVDVQWVVEGYGLFLSALILVGGALGDVIGRRLIFLLGAGLFAVASFACGLSSSILQLVIARCVQGIGAAALVPSSLAIISASFDEESRGRAIGTWSGFTAITTALGPVLGGWLVEHASWHWVFFINVPLAAGVIVISLLHISESRGGGSRNAVDWLGAFVATVSLAGLVYGFIESATLGWSHPRVWGSLIAGFSCLVAFVLIEQRVPAPMMPLDLFRSRSFSGANLLTILLYAAMGIFFFLFPLNLIQIQGYSATAAGAASMPLILLIFLLSRWSGGLVAHKGARGPLVVGPLIVAAGFLLFAVPSVGSNYWAAFFPAFVVLGAGMSVSVAPLTTVVMSSVDRDRAGTASGINNAAARVTGVLAVAVLGVVMVQAFSHNLQNSLARLQLTSSVMSDMQKNSLQLGALKAPSNLDASTAAAVRADIAEAFVSAFRLVMIICAGLAAASAGVALRMIPSRQSTRATSQPIGA
jgi:EmrB/QacA subfamily drug resistance transporter